MPEGWRTDISIETGFRDAKSRPEFPVGKGAALGVGKVKGYDRYYTIVTLQWCKVEIDADILWATNNEHELPKTCKALIEETVAAELAKHISVYPQLTSHSVVITQTATSFQPEEFLEATKAAMHQALNGGEKPTYLYGWYSEEQASTRLPDPFRIGSQVFTPLGAIIYIDQDGNEVTLSSVSENEEGYPGYDDIKFVAMVRESQCRRGTMHAPVISLTDDFSGARTAAREARKRLDEAERIEHDAENALTAEDEQQEGSTENSTNLFENGKASLLSGDLLGGVQAFRKAIEASPDITDQIYNVALALRGGAEGKNKAVGGNIYFSDGIAELDAAIAALELLSEFEPKKADLWFQLGLFCDNRCYFDKAAT